jgi:hypothetical protein
MAQWHPMIAFLLVFVALGRLYRDMFKQVETRALLMVATVVLAIGIVFYMRVEGWSLLDAIYFCVVTLGTVGYGDITPSTSLGKLFTVIYIIMGLGVIGGFFAAVGRMFRPGQLLSREESRLVDEFRKRRSAHRQDEAIDQPGQTT